MSQPVTDKQDPRVAQYLNLCAERDRRDDPTFIVEGAICVRRALEGEGVQVESVLGTPSQLDELAPLLKARRVPSFAADTAVLQAIAGFKFHRGCLAAVTRPRLPTPDFAALAATPRSLVVFAEVVSNPLNVGALIRNARSFGASLLVLSRGSADPYSRRAVRAAMGNVFSLAIAVCDEVAPQLEAFRATTGGEAWAATLAPGAQELPTLRCPPHLALVLGTENTGLLPGTVAACQRSVVIPMSPGADSLNVAAASAVLLYHVAQARR